MDRFSYTAYDASGVRREGELTALSQDSAKVRLKDQGLTVVELRSAAAMEAGPSAWLERITQRGRPGLTDLEMAASQMALLLQNGIKVDQALDTARRSAANRELTRVLEQAHGEVRSGASLAGVLARRPDIFDALFVSVVRIGEATGRLGDAFAELAANLRFRAEVRAKTRQALAYPLIIMVVCVLAVVFIFNFILPRFEVIFARTETLPVYTAALLGVSRFFVRWQWALLVLALAAPLALPRILRLPAVRDALDRLALALPLTRSLVLTLENLRFASAMALMLQSGVLLVDALGHAVRTVGNAALRRTLAGVREEVKQGGKLSQALAKTRFLPSIYAGVVEVGEQAGGLRQVFRDMELRTRTEYERQLSGLITLVEPLMIIVMGLIVGAIVVIMLLSTVSLQGVRF